MSNSQRPRQLRTRRRGLVLLIALVGLLVVSAVGATLLKTSLAQRRLVRAEQRRLQAEWLADAALSRAAARLEDDADYRGETWEIPGEEISGRVAGAKRSVPRSHERRGFPTTLRAVPVQPRPAGRVEITVAASGERPDLRRVTVVADYPPDRPHRVRVRRQITVHLKEVRE